MSDPLHRPTPIGVKTFLRHHPDQIPTRAPDTRGVNPDIVPEQVKHLLHVVYTGRQPTDDRPTVQCIRMCDPTVARDAFRDTLRAIRNSGQLTGSLASKVHAVLRIHG